MCSDPWFSILWQKYSLFCWFIQFRSCTTYYKSSIEVGCVRDDKFFINYWIHFEIEIRMNFHAKLVFEYFTRKRNTIIHLQILSLCQQPFALNYYVPWYAIIVHITINSNICKFVSLNTYSLNPKSYSLLVMGFVFGSHDIPPSTFIYLQG